MSTMPQLSLDDSVALARESALRDWLRARGTVLVGYSGGVDSSYLASVALDALGGDRVLAVLGRSESVAPEQWQRALDVARAQGLPFVAVDTSELSDDRYVANPVNRCYFCKAVLWSTLVPLARARGFAAVIDGTNADDMTDHRPGSRAAAEHGVESPLAELGFTKAEIRALSRRRGLSTWSQPASPCLASRIPYGTPVTQRRLTQVASAERALRELGIAGNLRVRHHGDLACVELDARELGRWLTPGSRRAVREAVGRAGFERVAIDLRGFRSGSLNVLEGVSR